MIAASFHSYKVPHLAIMSKYYCMRKVPSPRCLLFLGIFCVARCSEMECNHRSSCIIYNQADDCVHFKARSTFKGLSHEAQAHGRTRAQPVARAADAGGYILISRTTTQFLNVGVSRQRKKKRSRQSRNDYKAISSCSTCRCHRHLQSSISKGMKQYEKRTRSYCGIL